MNAIIHPKCVNCKKKGLKLKGGMCERCINRFLKVKIDHSGHKAEVNHFFFCKSKTEKFGRRWQ